MIKTTFPLAILLLFAGSTFAFSKKTDEKTMEKNYTEVIILDKGVKRIIHIPKDTNLTSKVGTYTIGKIEPKEGVMVSFANTAVLSISEFETKYGLKLKEKLAIGYYIFENISDKSDTEIINDIIDNESNARTVKPNWEKKNQPQ